MWVENLARDSIERREDQTAHSGAWMQSPVRQKWGWGGGREALGEGRKMLRVGRVAQRAEGP